MVVIGRKNGEKFYFQLDYNKECEVEYSYDEKKLWKPLSILWKEKLSSWSFEGLLQYDCFLILILWFLI